MGYTITVPPVRSNPNTPPVPHPMAFTRTKEFLKDLLRPLCDTQHEFIMSIGVKKAMQEMVRQLRMYARREGPFASLPTSDTLSWWRALSESYDANILAVRLSLPVSGSSSPPMLVPRNSYLLRNGEFNGR